MGYIKKNKLIIIGLSYFGKRLLKEIQTFDPSIKVIYLDTYYSKLDKLKFLFLLPFYNSVLSINGSNVKSLSFSYTLFLKKKLWMVWVGSDLLLAKENFGTSKERKDYIQKAHHLCEVNWIQKELEKINISAQVCNFISFNEQFEFKEPIKTPQLNVLSYVAQGKEDFYGMDWIVKIAKKTPEIKFTIVGTKGEKNEQLPNINYLGWVQNMDECFAMNEVCLRIPKHDGLSSFVLESLARGKQVIYRFPFKHTLYVKDYASFEKEILNLLYQKKEGNSLHNIEGKVFIEREFNRRVIISNLLNHITK